MKNLEKEFTRLSEKARKITKKFNEEIIDFIEKDSDVNQLKVKLTK